jgi:opacity protein-like surface antigen
MRQTSLAKQAHLCSTLILLTLSVLVGLPITCVPAAAQSEWQVFGGFSYVRAETSPVLQPLGLQHINAYGWDSAVSQYPWRWLGATFDVSGAYRNPPLTIPANYVAPGVPATDTTLNNVFHTSAYTLMFGPSFAYRRNPNIQPFAHVLFGGVRAQASLTGKGELLTGMTASSSEWAFVYALGGGVDIKMTKLVAVRGQVDWIRSSFSNLDIDRQNNIRVYVGLVFRFGGVNNESASLRSPKPPASGSSQPSPNTPGDAASNLAKVQSPEASGTGPVSTPRSPAVVAIQPGGGVNKESARLGSPQAPASGSSQPSANTPSNAASNLAKVQSPEASGADPASTPRSPAIAPTQPASSAPVQQTTVEFWSRPAGADIELDGNYIGSTPSTITVPAGDHTVTIRKRDFRTWQETVKVASRNVRVAAYLEQVRVRVQFDH